MEFFMNMYANLAEEQQSLVNELTALYQTTKAEMNDQDIDHIRNVAAYSKAIKLRSEQLIRECVSLESWGRGIILGCLHTLLEFSELGHNIMHGSYDHLPQATEFHSERWVWDFVTDPREWRVMHHQNHHPFTNIVGKDHDLGYSFLRSLAGQSWYGHHSVQLLIYSALMITPSYYFTLYTATSAARTEGRKILSKETFTQSLRLIKAHVQKQFIEAPVAAKWSKKLPVFIGNYLTTTIGYGFLLHILFLEHHAENLELYSDPGPDETQEEYFIRQIKSTTNFIPYAPLDQFLKKILDEEVPYPNPPPFEIFYGGLDTHLEHHLFPDLACNRQRQIKAVVRSICEKYHLPYHNSPMEKLIPAIPLSLIKRTLPFGNQEKNNPLKLLIRPKELLKRIKRGIQYQPPSTMTYLHKPQFYNASAKVVQVEIQLNGQVKTLKMSKPQGWKHLKWQAGAFISLSFEINGQTYIRQYSLLHESQTADGYFEIAVKRTPAGIVSHYIHDHVPVNTEVTIVSPPQSTPDFVLDTLPPKLIFIAAGVGITPILSMLRKYQRIESKAEAHLFYFNHDENSILFENEIRQIAKHSNLNVHFICSKVQNESTSDLRQGRFSLEIFQPYIRDFKCQHVYACAPQALIDSARQQLIQAGVKAAAFHTENFKPAPLSFESDGITRRVIFKKSNTSIDIEGNVTLLEAARQAGLKLPSGCQQGLCKACVCTKLEGQTQLEVDSSTIQHRITLCNTVARSPIIVLDV